jgi:hypothetical protein
MDQMVTYLTRRRFSSGPQYPALLNITDDIYGMLDQKYFVALVLLDFSKAFDSIDHLLLCRKLKNRYGFSSSDMSLIASFNSLRFQC